LCAIAEKHPAGLVWQSDLSTLADNSLSGTGKYAVLLEDFLNRYRNPRLPELKFPSVVFPAMFIVGVFTVLVGTPLIMALSIMDCAPGVLTPKLTFVSSLVGGGLFLSSTAVAIGWGLWKEKQRGIQRSNFHPIMLMVVFLFFLSAPFPIFYAVKF